MHARPAAAVEILLSHRPAIHHAASQENKENKGQRDEGSAPSLWASSATAPPRPGGVRVARGRFASTVGSTISRASCSDCTVFYMRTCLATNACNSAIWVRSCFSLVSRRHSGSNKRAEPKHKSSIHPPLNLFQGILYRRSSPTTVPVAIF